MPDICETWGELFPNPLKYLQDFVYYSKIYPGPSGTEHFQSQDNGRILRSIIQQPSLGASLPTTGPICTLGVPARHLGTLEANSWVPEDEHR